jgi:hypothetical protein
MSPISQPVLPGDIGISLAAWFASTQAAITDWGKLGVDPDP